MKDPEVLVLFSLILATTSASAGDSVVKADFKLPLTKYGDVREVAEVKLLEVAKEQGYSGIRDVDTHVSCLLVVCFVNASAHGTK